MSNGKSGICFNGLTTVNVELTSRCNKDCWMCGRRELEKKFPHLVDWGDMPFKMVQKIAEQLPHDIIVQLHNNGESLLYPDLSFALSEFSNQIRCLDTNAKLLVAKADDVIGRLDTLTISVIENDPEGDEQYDIVKRFLDIKGDVAPFMVYRLLGKVKKPKRWYELPGTVVTRTLHSPSGSHTYEKKVTKPEIGICLDLLHHLVIDRFGDVYPCVRFNPRGYGVLGNVMETPLIEIWNSKKRREWISKHISQKRNAVPICRETKCEYWGCPVG